MSSSPPPSPVKLFVGQVSRAMTEQEIAAVFSPYGTIVQVVVIRDRLSHLHRGCAFVSFETSQQADAAVAALHGVYRCEGMQNPLQIAPANGRATNAQPRAAASNKLYVGGFSESCDQEALTKVFSRFGTVVDVSILRRRRSSDNLCCAFIKFASREEAKAAIEGLTGSKELDLVAGTTPLVVKYAENRERGAWGAYSPYDYWGQVPGMPMYNPYFLPMGSLAQLPSDSSVSHGAFVPRYGSSSPPQHSPFGGPAGMGGLSLGPSGMGGLADIAPTASSFSPPLPYLSSLPSSLPPLHLPLPLPMSTEQPAAAAVPAASPFRVVTPQDFCTVYVYNLPEDWTDEQLKTLGLSIGAVQRATVCMNRVTGTSKGYGFIVFEDPEYVPRALQTICTTQIAPDHYLSAQMSNASLSVLSSFTPHSMMPVGYMAPQQAPLASSARGRGGRARGRGDWGGTGRGGKATQRGREEGKQ